MPTERRDSAQNQAVLHVEQAASSLGCAAPGGKVVADHGGGISPSSSPPCSRRLPDVALDGLRWPLMPFGSLVVDAGTPWGTGAPSAAETTSDSMILLPTEETSPASFPRPKGRRWQEAASCASSRTVECAAWHRSVLPEPLPGLHLCEKEGEIGCASAFAKADLIAEVFCGPTLLLRATPRRLISRDAGLSSSSHG